MLVGAKYTISLIRSELKKGKTLRPYPAVRRSAYAFTLRPHRPLRVFEGEVQM
ncbi:hypothetical protein [Nostoc favosum]|uniref:Uncharacterized protein n=1 Tax=Nostoc favosum CHAB5714 TaxID=2780399 RepID=A0ABS8IDD2_9NOSO|nr:hypothetical protein [Nostoc favosum]MCC5602088.1 hypothetical protein [Nostoc favosum CHAB5714]